MGYTVTAIHALIDKPIAGAARTSDNSDIMKSRQGARIIARVAAISLIIWARVLRGAYWVVKLQPETLHVC
jgi:hypothetical protein